MFHGPLRFPCLIIAYKIQFCFFEKFTHSLKKLLVLINSPFIMECLLNIHTQQVTTLSFKCCIPNSQL